MQEAAALAAESVTTRSSGALERSLAAAERCLELRVAALGEQHAEVAAARGQAPTIAGRRGLPVL